MFNLRKPLDRQRGSGDLSPRELLGADISPQLYTKTLLGFDCALAERLRPYGIHHCGNNTHLFAEIYARTGSVFCDVGWGSDVGRCNQALPDAFLNLRLCPMRMLACSADEMRGDAERLRPSRQEDAGRASLDQYGPWNPDANVLAMLAAARSWV